jgi:hypothetical protein
MRRNKQLRGTPCIALKAILASKRFNRGGYLSHQCPLNIRILNGSISAWSRRIKACMSPTASMM